MFVNEEGSIHVLFIRILISHKNVNALLDFEHMGFLNFIYREDIT